MNGVFGFKIDLFGSYLLAVDVDGLVDDVASSFAIGASQASIYKGIEDCGFTDFS